MFKRQTSGSVVCPACGRLVGVLEGSCFNCGYPNPGLWGYAPLLRRLGQDLGFVKFVIGGCIAVYLLTLLADPAGVRMQGALAMLSPSLGSLLRFGASGGLPVFSQHHWWTLLSASWLHGGLLHILFNMLWVRQLAPATARLYGPGRMMMIYLLSGVSGFLLSSLVGAMRSPYHITIGASASIFGLLGALVLYGRKVGGGGALGQQAWTWALALFLLGLFMPGVDNFAHFGGFVGGYAVARWLDPLLPERQDHLLFALVGIALTVASILVSVVVG